MHMYAYIYICGSLCMNSTGIYYKDIYIHTYMIIHVRKGGSMLEAAQPIPRNRSCSKLRPATFHLADFL